MTPSPASGSVPAVHHHEEVEEVERPRLAIQEHDADQEADVARLRRPERLHRRPGRLGPLVPVPDQQIGAEADQLPADEELDEVGREHEPHHREREERLVGVVAPEGRRRLVGQVAEGVELDEEGHARHEHEHQRGVGVREDADARERARLHGDPRPDPEAEAAARRDRPRPDRAGERPRGQQGGQIGGGPAGAAQRHHEREQQERRRGKQDGGERERARIPHRPASTLSGCPGGRPSRCAAPGR